MATGATEFIDVTTADVFIGENWSKQYVIAREENLIFAPTFTHKYQADLKMGDTVHIPNVTGLTSQTKNTSTNQAVVFETITETNAANLVINTWRYNGIAQETFAKSVANSDLLAVYAPKQAYAIGEAFDAALAAFVDDFTNTVGTLTVDLTYENLLRARQYLGDANAPFSGRHIGISPAQEEGFLAVDQFIHADYSRLSELTPAQEAVIGSWMRIPVSVSTNVEGSNAAGHDNGMWHEDAVAWGMSLEPEVHVQFDINYLAQKVVVEQGDGSIEVRDDHGVFMPGA